MSIKHQLRKIIIRILDFLVALVPFSILESLEWRIQKNLGKGIGYNSLNLEVRGIKFFIKQKSLQKIVLLDVGANIGQYAEQFKSEFPNCEIHSFEPSDDAFLTLSEKTKHYSNWNIYNFGFGSKSETLRLNSQSPASASATLASSQFTDSLQLKFSQNVRIETIDEFLSKNTKILPTILKLDVEGWEMECLKGAAKSLDQIQIIQFEFGEISINSRIYFRDFWEFFTARNYDIYRVTPRGFHPIKLYSESYETFAVTNYFAIKK